MRDTDTYTPINTYTYAVRHANAITPGGLPTSIYFGQRVGMRAASYAVHIRHLRPKASRAAAKVRIEPWRKVDFRVLRCKKGVFCISLLLG